MKRTRRVLALLVLGVMLFWVAEYVSSTPASTKPSTGHAQAKKTKQKIRIEQARHLRDPVPSLRSIRHKSTPSIEALSYDLEIALPIPPPALLGSPQEIFAVIIRCRAEYVKHLLSLLWALEAQTVNSGIYVIVAPTEYESIDIINSTIQHKWPRHSKVSVRVMDLAKEQYENHSGLLKVLCTPSWREEKQLLHWKKEWLDRYCDIDTPLHYFVTDSALGQAKQECPTCEYLLVTNADSYYSPDFFSKTGRLLISSDSDVVLTDMLHRGQSIETAVEEGRMDLGCALIKCSAFYGSEGLNFTSSLPENPEPQNWHDGDFWMVYTLQHKYKRTVTFLRETLFVHN